MAEAAAEDERRALERSAVRAASSLAVAARAHDEAVLAAACPYATAREAASAAFACERLAATNVDASACSTAAEAAGWRAWDLWGGGLPPYTPPRVVGGFVEPGAATRRAELDGGYTMDVGFFSYNYPRGAGLGHIAACDRPPWVPNNPAPPTIEQCREKRRAAELLIDELYGEYGSHADYYQNMLDGGSGTWLDHSHSNARLDWERDRLRRAAERTPAAKRAAAAASAA